MQAASDLIQLWSILLSLCSAVQAAAEQLLKGGQITEEKRANLRQATIDGGPEQQTINEASPFRSAFRENTKSSLLINVSPPVSVSSKSGKCGLTFPPSSSFFLHLIIPHLCTKVHGRSRNYQPKSRGAHGDTHFMETRFRIPFLESEQTFEATQQKNGGSQHVFTQKNDFRAATRLLRVHLRSHDRLRKLSRASPTAHKGSRLNDCFILYFPLFPLVPTSTGYQKYWGRKMATGGQVPLSISASLTAGARERGGGVMEGGGRLAKPRTAPSSARVGVSHFSVKHSADRFFCCSIVSGI